MAEHTESESDFDTCQQRTQRRVRDLRRAGVDARWIQVQGMRVGAPDADPRWQEIPPSARSHYVVKVDGVYHDLAPRQFWPHAPAELVERDYMRRWEREADVTDHVDQD